MTYSVVVLGATGFIGSLVVNELLQDENNSGILSVSRHPTGVTHDRLNEIICPLEQINQYKTSISADVLVLALGASRQTGGDYSQVDCNLGLKAAAIARENGIKCCIAISSAMAWQWSPSGYLRIKAKFERELQQLNFDSLTILRPGPLVGRTKERWQETLFLPVLRILATLSGGARSPIRPVMGSKVAKCIAGICAEQQTATRFLSSADIVDGHF